MKNFKFFLIVLCFCGLFTSAFAGAIAGILDERNLLDEDFLQRWNNAIFTMESEFAVKITLLLLNEEKQVAGVPNNVQIPEITISHNDEAGFEIYLSNFDGESNFIIPSSFINGVIPEANDIFREGKASEAAEYILLNVREMLYSQKRVSAADEFEEKKREIPRNYNKVSYLLFAFSALFVLFVFIILLKRKKPLSADETLQQIIDFFGSHLLSVSSYSHTSNELKPIFLVQIDEPLLNLNIPKNTAFPADLPIYIITAREISTFAENFPIELTHIKNRYRKLYGKDPIAQMNVDFNNLHNAVIITLQRVLIQLRAAYLSKNYDNLLVLELMSKLYAIFEAALFLRSQSIPIGLSELVFKIESCYNLKNAVLSEIARKIEGNEIKGLCENMPALLTALEEILAEIKGIVVE